MENRRTHPIENNILISYQLTQAAVVVHLCSSHRHLHLSRVCHRPASPRVVLVGHRRLGHAAPKIRFLGSIHFHVWLHKGGKIGWLIQAKS